MTMTILVKVMILMETVINVALVTTCLWILVIKILLHAKKIMEVIDVFNATLNTDFSTQELVLFTFTAWNGMEIDVNNVCQDGINIVGIQIVWNLMIMENVYSVRMECYCLKKLAFMRLRIAWSMADREYVISVD